MNGKEANQYLDGHKEIVRAVLGYLQLSTLDASLLQIIREKLNSMGGSKRKRPTMPNQVSCSDSTALQADMQPDGAQIREASHEDTLLDDADWSCAHCAEAAYTNCIECSQCHEWMHWSCEKLTEELFEHHTANPDSEHICLLCRHDDDSDGAANTTTLVHTDDAATGN